MRRAAIAVLLACCGACSAPERVDPLDPDALDQLSGRDLDARWSWVHEPGRTDRDVPGWASLDDYERALRLEATRRHDWEPGFAQAIRSGRLVHDMTEEQVRWAAGPPAGTLTYRRADAQLTKWVGPLQGLNASWIVIFRNGRVIDITDRR